MHRCQQAGEVTGKEGGGVCVWEGEGFLGGKGGGEEQG